MFPNQRGPQGRAPPPIRAPHQMGLGVGGARPASALDLIEQLKGEYESLLQQLSLSKLERDEFERKLQSQLAEMDAIQQTLKSLESSHRRIKQQYEEEIVRLRRQSDIGGASKKRPNDNMLGSISSVGKSGTIGIGNVPALGSRPLNNDAFHGNSKRPKLGGEDARSESKQSEVGERSEDKSSGNSSGSGSATDKGKIKWSIQYNNKPHVFPEGEKPVIDVRHTLDHQSVVCCVRYSNDGTRVATGCHMTAQVFEVSTGRKVFGVSRAQVYPGATGDVEDAYVRAVTFSPDGTHLVAGMPQNTIKVWEVETQKEVGSFTGHNAEIYSLDYAGNYIASGSGDHKVRLWDVRNGACRAILGNDSMGPTDGVTSVAMSPDGRLLAAASLDKIVRIWDVETTQMVDRLEGHRESVYSIAFSPDGKSVISGSLDKTLMLWDVGGSRMSSSRNRLIFNGHKDFVLSVAFTPDGRWLMSGSKDRTVIFWDPRTTRSCLSLSGYRNSVISVASSPASSTFVTGSGDCFASLWNYKVV